MNDEIIKRCLILREMYYLESIKADIKNILELESKKQLKDKKLQKNFD